MSSANLFELRTAKRELLTGNLTSREPTGETSSIKSFQECNTPLDARKIRGDPKSRTQRPQLTRIEDALEVRQERANIDAGQFLRRVGLVRRFKRAVGDSLERLNLRHQAWIYNIAVRMVFGPQDAEEVKQEALIKAVTRLSKLRTWLYRISGCRLALAIRTAGQIGCLVSSRWGRPGRSPYVCMEVESVEIVVLNLRAYWKATSQMDAMRRNRDGR